MVEDQRQNWVKTQQRQEKKRLHLQYQLAEIVAREEALEKDLAQLQKDFLARLAKLTDVPESEATSTSAYLQELSQEQERLAYWQSQKEKLSNSLDSELVSCPLAPVWQARFERLANWDVGKFKEESGSQEAMTFSPVAAFDLIEKLIEMDKNLMAEKSSLLSGARQFQAQLSVDSWLGLEGQGLDDLLAWGDLLEKALGDLGASLLKDELATRYVELVIQLSELSSVFLDQASQQMAELPGGAELLADTREELGLSALDFNLELWTHPLGNALREIRHFQLEQGESLGASSLFAKSKSEQALLNHQAMGLIRHLQQELSQCDKDHLALEDLFSLSFLAIGPRDQALGELEQWPSSLRQKVMLRLFLVSWGRKKELPNSLPLLLFLNRVDEQTGLSDTLKVGQNKGLHILAVGASWKMIDALGRVYLWQSSKEKSAAHMIVGPYE